jgi:hypothetical protein
MYPPIEATCPICETELTEARAVAEPELPEGQEYEMTIGMCGSCGSLFANTPTETRRLTIEEERTARREPVVQHALMHIHEGILQHMLPVEPPSMN